MPKPEFDIVFTDLQRVKRERDEALDLAYGRKGTIRGLERQLKESYEVVNREVRKLQAEQQQLMARAAIPAEFNGFRLVITAVEYLQVWKDDKLVGAFRLKE